MKRMMTLFGFGALLLAGLFAAAAMFGGHSVAAQGPAGESEADDDANEGPDVAITGSALEQASAAALDYIGEGRVTETEVGDEEGYYEVEITRDNGREVDVHLDEAFNILGHEDD